MENEDWPRAEGCVCPYCKSVDVVIVPSVMDSRRRYVACNGCDASGPHKDTPADAIAAWNARAVPSVRPAKWIAKAKRLISELEVAAFSDGVSHADSVLTSTVQSEATNEHRKELHDLLEQIHADHFVDANKMMPITIEEARKALREPDIGFIQPIDGKWRFARRENGRCYWCVESKEEALQLASNLLHIAVMMEDWDD